MLKNFFSENATGFRLTQARKSTIIFFIVTIIQEWY